MVLKFNVGVVWSFGYEGTTYSGLLRPRRSDYSIKSCSEFKLNIVLPFSVWLIGTFLPILWRKKKANKQGKNWTNIIDYSKRITIQHSMYSIMNRLIPGALFLQILATSRVIFLNLNLRNSIAGIRSKPSPFSFVFLDFP